MKRRRAFLLCHVPASLGSVPAQAWTARPAHEDLRMRGIHYGNSRARISGAICASGH